MLDRLKNYFLAGVLAVFLIGPAPVVNAQFDFFKNSCSQAPNSTVCKEVNVCKADPASEACERSKDPVISSIRTAANILATVTAVAAVFMIILGAYNLVTSGGNAETIAKGRRRIIYSLVGVVVVALAWTITRFITDRVLQ